MFHNLVNNSDSNSNNIKLTTPNRTTATTAATTIRHDHHFLQEEKEMDPSFRVFPGIQPSPIAFTSPNPKNLSKITENDVRLIN